MSNRIRCGPRPGSGDAQRAHGSTHRAQRDWGGASAVQGVQDCQIDGTAVRASFLRSLGVRSPQGGQTSRTGSCFGAIHGQTPRRNVSERGPGQGGRGWSRNSFAPVRVRQDDGGARARDPARVPNQDYRAQGVSGDPVARTHRTVLPRRHGGHRSTEPTRNRVRLCDCDAPVAVPQRVPRVPI